MTQEMEHYLKNVKLRMFSMPGKAKKGVIQELRSHIMESAAAIGGPAMEGTIISQMDTPRRTAKRYKEIYGYNMLFKIFFVLICIFLAIWTVPIWELVNSSFSTTFIFLLIAAAAGEHGIIQGGGVFLFVLSSLLLIPIAYLPARVIEKWEERKYWPPPIPQQFETRPCPRCGLPNTLQSKFCNECGNRVW
jgi:hypothetical protein